MLIKSYIFYEFKTVLNFLKFIYKKKIQLFINVYFSDSGYRYTPHMTTLFSGPESVGITRFECNSKVYLSTEKQNNEPPINKMFAQFVN